MRSHGFSEVGALAIGPTAGARKNDGTVNVVCDSTL